MTRFLNRKLPHLSRRMMVLLLAFFWCSGSVLGIYASGIADESLLSLMRTAASGRVSIVGLLTAILLPFLLSALAVFLNQLWLLLPIAFGKAFTLCYAGYGIFAAFGSAGWLIRLLLMFSDCCTAPVLIWLWVHCAAESRKSLFSFVGPVLLALTIGSVDFYVVSPFLAMLIS